MSIVALVADQQRNAEQLKDAVTKKGAVFELLNCITIEPLPQSEKVRDAVLSLASYDWLIFTSQHAVTFFFAALQSANSSLPSTLKVAAVGLATSKALKERKVQVDLMPKKFSAVELGELLGVEVAGKHILFPSSAIALDDVVDVLTKYGALVDALSLYTVGFKTLSSAQQTLFKNGEIHFLIFLSPSGVQALVASLTDAAQSYFQTITAICIGPQTAKAAKTFPFQKVVVAKNATMESIVDVLEQVL